jgi:alpha-L-fucosidase
MPIDRRAVLAGLAASSLPVSSLAAAKPAAFTLPDLPPMPALPPRLPINSIDMEPAAGAPEVKLDLPIAPGPFKPDWQDISTTYQQPDSAWLREAKFGIWVHFGAQASGQSGDWYAKRLYLQHGKYESHYQNHLKRFGHPSQVGYKDVLQKWNPSALDPEALVKTYQDAGARFLILLGVHHDNYDNWDSRYQKWNSANIGPKRDLVGEWSKAAKRAGMRYGVSFHHEYTWWWYQTAFGADTDGPLAGVPYDGNLTLADGKGKWWEGYDPRLLYTNDIREYRGLDVEFAPAGGIFSRHPDYAKWYATWWALRIMDAVEKYDPDFVYTDGNSTGPFSGLKSGTGMKSDAAARLFAHVFNRRLARHKEVDCFGVIKFKPAGTRGIVGTQEGGVPKLIRRDQPWIAETPVGDWFYAPGFTYDPPSVVRYLIDSVSRDGAVALCISLTPEGALDEGSQKLLAEVGAWLKVNGDGIYGSRAWEVAGEGRKDSDGLLIRAPGGKLGEAQAKYAFAPEDIRFTQGKDGALYAWTMTLPNPGETVRVTSLGVRQNRQVKHVDLLGHPGEIQWAQNDEALVITVPERLPCSIALGFRMRV